MPHLAADRSPPEDDDRIVLYARRKQIYPKLVFGRFRTIKWAVLFATLGVYYLLPWLRWDRGPGAPDQAVLADFAGGRFYFFGLEIWPQEVYYITGLLILAALGLFLVTALFRPRLVRLFLPADGLDRSLPRRGALLRGRPQRPHALDKAPWSFDKAWRKTGKHAVWLLVSFATGGAFIFYWHDAPYAGADLLFRAGAD